MPGGPVATGGGIGANTPKTKLAGIVMVCPFSPAHLSLSHPCDFSPYKVLFRCIRWNSLGL